MSETDTDKVLVLVDALDAACLAFASYVNANTAIDQATYLMRLNDTMNDLASWSPNYNMNTGCIDEKEEDA